MSETTEASVGQVLREAREAQGISVDDASMRLRLMHRQIVAMEADDFASLGPPVFARGFVRNYARLLGVDADALLVRMVGAPAEPSAIVQPAPQLPQSWLSSPWVLLLLLGVLVLVAAPLGLYLWLNSDVDGDERIARPPAQVVPAPVPAADTPAAEATDPAAASGEPDAAAQTEAPAADASAADATPADAAPAPGKSTLKLEFAAESWTEIRDATKRYVHRQLNPAGTTVVVTGEPPLDVVIGNAGQARLTYNGRPIDLKPFTDSTVARFTLEE